MSNSVSHFCNTNATNIDHSYASIGILWINDAVVLSEKEMVHSIIVPIITVLNMMKQQEYVRMEMSEFFSKISNFVYTKKWKICRLFVALHIYICCALMLCWWASFDVNLSLQFICLAVCVRRKRCIGASRDRYIL